VGLCDPLGAQLNAMLAEIPLVTGYSTKWWQKSINILTEKVVGNNVVEKLWIIHLLRQILTQTTNGWASPPFTKPKSCNFWQMSSMEVKNFIWL